MSERLFKDLPDILQVEQLQAALHIGRKKAYSLLRTGKIQSLKIGRAYKIPKPSLIEYINNSCNKLSID